MSVDNITPYQVYGATRNPFSYAKFEQVSRDTQTEWLTLAQITAQLNLFEDTSQNSFLTSLDLATRFAIEDYLGVSFFSTQYRVYYGDTGVYGSQLYLDLPEVTIGSGTGGAGGVTINEVGYFTDGASGAVYNILPSSQYYYDQTGNRVVITAIPSALSQTMANPIQVLYSESPSPLLNNPAVIQAGLLLLTHLYNNRSATVDSGIREIPYGVDVLLRPYKPLVM
jgi:hypothetical protein